MIFGLEALSWGHLQISTKVWISPQLRVAITPRPLGLRIWYVHQNFGNFLNFQNLWKKLDFGDFSRPYDPLTPQNRFSPLMSLLSISSILAPDTSHKKKICGLLRIFLFFSEIDFACQFPSLTKFWKPSELFFTLTGYMGFFRSCPPQVKGLIQKSFFWEKIPKKKMGNLLSGG